jgi:hypothetical protein
VPPPDEAPSRAGLIGEYLGLACWDGYLTPVWTDTRNGHQDTYGGALVGTAVEDGEPGLVMLRAWPNPTDGPVTLAYAVPEDGPVRLELFDLAGRRVRTLVDRRLRSGRHRFVWDGTDQSGRRVATGSYLVRFQAPGAVATRTVTLSR